MLPNVLEWFTYPCQCVLRPLQRRFVAFLTLVTMLGCIITHRKVVICDVTSLLCYNISSHTCVVSLWISIEHYSMSIVYCIAVYNLISKT